MWLSQRWFATNILYIQFAIVYVPILVLGTVYEIALIRRYGTIIRNFNIMNTVALAILICLLTLLLPPANGEESVR